MFIFSCIRHNIMQQRNAMPVLVSGGSLWGRVWAPVPLESTAWPAGAAEWSISEWAGTLVPPRTKATAALLRTLQADERGRLSRSSVLTAWTLTSDVLLMSVSKGKRSFRLWLSTLYPYVLKNSTDAGHKLTFTSESVWVYNGKMVYVTFLMLH